MFKALGIAVFAYVLYAASQGRVYAKSGPWGRVIEREHERTYFWVVIAIYTGLSLALFFVF